jgi:hypothetical protein
MNIAMDEFCTVCTNLSHNCGMKIYTIFAFVFLVFTSSAANAEDILGYLTDKEGNYSGPTVEDNILAMDTDKNGFADVMEVRAFLASKHGKDYQKALLDRWQLRSQGPSCTLPPDDKLF